MKNIAIIQARCGSQRFPNKVFQKLWSDKTVLEVLIERLRLSEQLDMIVVATTNEPEDLQLVELCEKIGIDCINKGNKDSALDSVIQAGNYVCDLIEENDFNVIDITADCPFIDPFQLDKIIRICENNLYDYLSNCMIRSFPLGFDIQMYTFDVLLQTNKIVTNKNHRMHCGWNIWAYSEKLQDKLMMFKYGNIIADEKYFNPDWRIVLDYKEDLFLLQNIINYFDRIDFTYQEVINYLTNNPELLEVNKNCKQKIAGKE